MRRIVVFDRVTADGYFADKDGKLDWVVPDEALDADVSRQIRSGQPEGGGLPSPDTVLFGRRTYQMFASFWPKAAAEAGEQAPNPHGPSGSPAMKDMALWLDRAEKVVYSRSLREAGWKNAVVEREVDPRAIETRKRQAGRDMMVFGSGSLVSQLAALGLVDEYQLVMCPVFLGEGRALLNDVPRRSLRLLESKPYPTGNLLLRYRPA